MAEENRPEVNLEVCSGFFRIPTKDLIFNIKVLESNESSTTRVIEKIIEVEKKAAPTAPPPLPEPSPQAPNPQPVAAEPQVDDYYQQAAIKFCAKLNECQSSDSGQDAHNSSLNGINDLGEMANELSVVLGGVKSQPPPNADSNNSNSGNMDEALKSITDKIIQAKKLVGSPVSKEAPAPPKKNTPAAAPQKITRYLFNFDAVFQTIYELCTNETVKEHVQKARAKADEIFSKEKFYDSLSPKVAKLQEDDGFFSIPMSDIYTSLSASCSDKSTSNLLKKMDQQQSDIFLDQFLPLEVPPTEEIEIPGQAPANDDEPHAAGNESPAAPSATGGLAAILDNIEKELRSLSQAGQGNSSVDTGNSESLADDVDNAINIAVSINYYAQKLAQTSKIDNQFKLLPMREAVVFMESLLSQKEEEPSLIFSTGEETAKVAAEKFNSQETAKLDELASPVEDEEDNDEDDSGEVGQDDIDRLLEEMG